MESGFNKSSKYIEKLNCLIELHIHLDGAVSPESAKMLAKMQGIPLPETDEELLSMMRVGPDCRHLDEFLTKFEFPNSLLQTYDGIKTAVKNLLNELHNGGVMYAEIRFAPQKCTDKGLTQEEAVKAAIEGAADSRTECQFILCGIRTEGDVNKAENLETLDLVEKYLGKGVCAFDYAAAELPTEDYAYMLRDANRRNVPFTIHVGEAAYPGRGPREITPAIDCGAKRIGHGVRAHEDMRVVKRLAEKKIPLELCPTSNVKTAIFESIADIPIPMYMDEGIICTINTDDPSVEGTDLRTEFRLVADTYGFGKDRIETLLINAADSAFAPEGTRERLKSEIRREFSEISD